MKQFAMTGALLCATFAAVMAQEQPAPSAAPKPTYISMPKMRDNASDAIIRVVTLGKDGKLQLGGVYPHCRMILGGPPGIASHREIEAAKAARTAKGRLHELRRQVRARLDSITDSDSFKNDSWQDKMLDAERCHQTWHGHSPTEITHGSCPIETMGWDVFAKKLPDLARGVLARCPWLEESIEATPDARVSYSAGSSELWDRYVRGGTVKLEDLTSTIWRSICTWKWERRPRYFGHGVRFDSDLTESSVKMLVHRDAFREFAKQINHSVDESYLVEKAEKLGWL